jgi:hypothetical protein
VQLALAEVQEKQLGPAPKQGCHRAVERLRILLKTHAPDRAESDGLGAQPERLPRGSFLVRRRRPEAIGTDGVVDDALASSGNAEPFARKGRLVPRDVDGGAAACQHALDTIEHPRACAAALCHAIVGMRRVEHGGGARRNERQA